MLRGAAITILFLGLGCIPPQLAARTDTVGTATAIDGVDVRAVAEGPVGWTIEVRNRTPDQIKLLWDDSTYVTSNGHALGRLIRGETRRIHSAMAQPPTPVPAGSVLSEYALPEQATEYTSQPPAAYFAGRITLVFENAAGDRLQWVGEVKNGRKRGAATERVDAGLYCARSGTGQTPGVCGRGLGACEARRDDANKPNGDLGECAPTQFAFCFDFVDDFGKVESCHPTPKSCDLSRGDKAVRCESRN